MTRVQASIAPEAGLKWGTHGRYASPMPRAARYSSATKKLSDELSALGYHYGCSALETWAGAEMAPRQVRRSKGRQVSASEAA